MTVRPIKHPAAAAIRAMCLAYPGAFEDHPWGDTVFKVNKKVFVFMGVDDDGQFGISTKLPHTGGMALSLPFATPTGYGLGKAGWVTARFAQGEKVPVELLAHWVKESFLAVAPAKVAQAFVDGANAVKAPVKKTKNTKPAAKKAKRSR